MNAAAPSARTAGLLLGIAFTVTIMGANLVNPLMPLYVERYHLSSLLQGSLFAVYLGTLVVVLVALSARSLSQRALVAVLITGLAAGTFGDLVTLGATWALPALFLGRAVTGLGVGLATAATSALALRLRGPRARTLVGTGAVLGSLLGNFLAGLQGTVLPMPTVWTYLVHISAMTLLLVLVAVIVPRALGNGIRDVPDVRGLSAGALLRRHRLAGYLLGAGSWIAAAIFLSLLPSALRTDPRVTPLVAALPTSVMLAVAFACQTVLRPVIHAVRAWHLAPLLVGGFVVLSVGVQAHSWMLIVTASVLIGVAQGPAYSLGLATVTHGLAVSHHGRTTSGYAAVSYLSCAGGALIVGAVASSIGMASALLAAAAVVLVIGIAAIAFAGPRQDLVAEV